MKVLEAYGVARLLKRGHVDFDCGADSIQLRRVSRERLWLVAVTWNRIWIWLVGGCSVVLRLRDAWVHFRSLDHFLARLGSHHVTLHRERAKDMVSPLNVQLT